MYKFIAEMDWWSQAVLFGFVALFILAAVIWFTSAMLDPYSRSRAWRKRAVSYMLRHLRAPLDRMGSQGRRASNVLPPPPREEVRLPPRLQVIEGGRSGPRSGDYRFARRKKDKRLTGNC